MQTTIQMCKHIRKGTTFSFGVWAANIIMILPKFAQTAKLLKWKQIMIGLTNFWYHVPWAFIRQENLRHIAQLIKILTINQKNNLNNITVFDKGSIKYQCSIYIV